MEPLFHTAQSALVDRGLVILHVGGHKDGALTAFDPATGAVKWTWNGDGPAYGSPIIAEIDGTRQVIVFSQDNLVGVDASNGQLLWRTPFTARSVTNSITPLVYGGRTIIVSGQGKPLTAYTIAKKDDQWTAEMAWENPQLSMSFSNAVLVGDAVFSMSAMNSGQFFWADAKTGKTLWTSSPRQASNAAIVRSGNLLFVLKDDAELMVARSTPGGFEPLKTYTVADSATWPRAGLFGQSDLREGHLDDRALDGELDQGRRLRRTRHTRRNEATEIQRRRQRDAAGFDGRREATRADELDRENEHQTIQWCSFSRSDPSTLVEPESSSFVSVPPFLRFSV